MKHCLFARRQAQPEHDSDPHEPVPTVTRLRCGIAAGLGVAAFVVVGPGVALADTSPTGSTAGVLQTNTAPVVSQGGNLGTGGISGTNVGGVSVPVTILPVQANANVPVTANGTGTQIVSGPPQGGAADPQSGGAGGSTSTTSSGSTRRSSCGVDQSNAAGVVSQGGNLGTGGISGTNVGGVSAPVTVLPVQANANVPVTANGTGTQIVSSGPCAVSRHHEAEDPSTSGQPGGSSGGTSGAAAGGSQGPSCGVHQANAAGVVSQGGNLGRGGISGTNVGGVSAPVTVLPVQANANVPVTANGTGTQIVSSGPCVVSASSPLSPIVPVAFMTAPESGGGSGLGFPFTGDQAGVAGQGPGPLAALAALLLGTLCCVGAIAVNRRRRAAS